MRRYPVYKDSGIEWIDEIPEHWDKKALKFFSHIVLGKMLTPQDKGGYFLKPYLKAKNILWEKVDDTDISEMWFSENELSQYRLQKNDLLVSEGGEVGRTAIWQNEIPECYIQNSVNKVSINSNCHPRFYLYTFGLYGRIGYFDSIVNRVSIAHLTREKLKDVIFFVPPSDEQQAIADYLDAKTALIDELICKKRRQIELLKEQRQAVINQAVTKGLDPNVEMKDSGIEWLGEIPKHWEVKKLKYVITIKSGDGVSNENINPEGEYPIYGGNGLLGYTNDFNVDGNTLVVGRVGAKCGNVHLVEGNYWVSDNALVTKTNQNYEFMYFLLTSMNLNNLANQNAQPLITATMVKFQYVALPDEAEQIELVEHIKLELSKIQEAESKAERQIQLLQEYRTALISEAVTGKIDVREAV